MSVGLVLKVFARCIPGDPVIHPTINRASIAIISSDLYVEWREPRWPEPCSLETILAAIGLLCRVPRVCNATPCADPGDGRCIFRSSVTSSREERVEQVMPVAGSTSAFASGSVTATFSPFFRFDALCPPSVFPSSSSSSSSSSLSSFPEDRAPMELDGP